MGQLDLLQVLLPVEAVHDPGLPGGLARRLGGIPYPFQELHRLLLVSHRQQGLGDHGGVPKPGVSVVPVQVPSHHLRQRGRGGSRDRPGVIMYHKLQRQLRAGHQGGPLPGPVGVLVVHGRMGPSPPGLHRPLQQRPAGVDIARGVVGAVPRDQGPLLVPAEMEDAPDGRTVLILLQPALGEAAQREPAALPGGGPRISGPFDGRPLASIVGPGAPFDAYVHLLSAAADQTLHLVQGGGAPLPPYGAPQRHEVGHAHDGALWQEGGPQHVRPVDVPLPAGGALHPHPEPAPLIGIEDPTEHAAPAHVRKAQPVQGAVRADQAHGAEVPDGPVALYGPVSAVSHRG